MTTKMEQKLASVEQIMTTEGTQFWDAEQIKTTCGKQI
jgi:hypothetical protein